jgi:hypothetical protein
MSITMQAMIDPITSLQAHTSLETRPYVQAHTMLEKTPSKMRPVDMLGFWPINWRDDEETVF